MRKRKPGVIPIAVDRRVDKRDRQINARTTTRTVADPYSATGGVITVTASLRDDPLGRLHARRQITDCQHATGHYVQNLFELSAIGSIQAMDPGKEAVDGRGAFVEPITDSQRRAVLRLQEARQCLGARGYALVRAILSDRLFIEQIAASQGLTSDSERKFLGRRFREALEELAYEFGFAGRAPSAKRQRDEFTDASKHADSPKLRAAVNLARQIEKEAA